MIVNEYINTIKIFNALITIIYVYITSHNNCIYSWVSIIIQFHTFWTKIIPLSSHIIHNRNSTINTYTFHN